MISITGYQVNESDCLTLTFNIPAVGPSIKSMVFSATTRAAVQEPAITSQLPEYDSILVVHT
jgi:hypothetical protein